MKKKSRKTSASYECVNLTTPNHVLKTPTLPNINRYTFNLLQLRFRQVCAHSELVVATNVGPVYR